MKYNKRLKKFQNATKNTIQNQNANKILLVNGIKVMVVMNYRKKEFLLNKFAGEDFKLTVIVIVAMRVLRM